MQSRLVPLDLLFVRRPRVDGEGSIAPLVCLYPEVSKWKAAFSSIQGLASLSRPIVSQLSRDRLLLESGVNQAVLRKSAGKRWMQVEMPDEVCRWWDARSTNTLDRVVRETDRTEFYNPVLHANYRRVRVCRPDSVRLDRIRRWLGHRGEGLRGLDIGCNMGYTSHMFQRQGVQMTGVDFDEKHLKVARALNDTYSLDVEFHNCRFEELAPASGYDVVVMLTVFYHTLRRSKSEAAEMIERLDNLGAQVLFWESGDEPQQERDFIREHSCLTEFISLGPTYGTSLYRELGIFHRPAAELAEPLQAQQTAASK